MNYDRIMAKQHMPAGKWILGILGMADARYLAGFGLSRLRAFGHLQLMNDERVTYYVSAVWQQSVVPRIRTCTKVQSQVFEVFNCFSAKSRDSYLYLTLRIAYTLKQQDFEQLNDKS